jgi:shikimate kinase
VAARPEQIVLIGLPGAGKSTVGPLLAGRLGFRFLDLDRLIEAEAGLTIAQIFEQMGEAEFRRIEAELTGRLASEPDLVLAPGGGWILRNTLPAALLVWLVVDPDEASLRVGEFAGSRPLLQPDPLTRLKELLAEREPYYMRADITIDTTGKSPAHVADTVAAAIEEKHGDEKSRKE